MNEAIATLGAIAAIAAGQYIGPQQLGEVPCSPQWTPKVYPNGDWTVDFTKKPRKWCDPKLKVRKRGLR